MGTFVIRRTDGAFVARIELTGGASYTNKLQLAKTFTSYDAAQRECCGNEYVTEIENCFGR